MTYSELVSKFTPEQKELIEKLLARLAERHPYKVRGNQDSYTDYNQGWTNAIDTVATIFIHPHYADIEL